ncbi:MAG: hypothetical protein RI920_579, partial [Pseudomonadota bacterium]
MGDLSSVHLNLSQVTVGQWLLIIGLPVLGCGALEGWVLSRLKPGSYDWAEHH